jgi:hypothetical protein
MAFLDRGRSTAPRAALDDVKLGGFECPSIFLLFAVNIAWLRCRARRQCFHIRPFMSFRFRVINNYLAVVAVHEAWESVGGGRRPVDRLRSSEVEGSTPGGRTSTPCGARFFFPPSLVRQSLLFVFPPSRVQRPPVLGK